MKYFPIDSFLLSSYIIIKIEFLINTLFDFLLLLTKYYQNNIFFNETNNKKERLYAIKAIGAIARQKESIYTMFVLAEKIKISLTLRYFSGEK